MRRRLTFCMGLIAALPLSVYGSLLGSSSYGLFSSFMENGQIPSMLRGARRLSIMNHIVTDDDIFLKKGGSESSTTARKISVDTASSSSKTNSSVSGSSTTTTIVDHPVKNTTKLVVGNTTKPLGNVTKLGPTVKETESPEKLVPPSPGEHPTALKKPLPPSYNYKDDDVNYPGMSVDSRLNNPVVDDISQFLDDKVYPNVTHIMLPPERELPTHWPLDVFIIFLAAAAVLFLATAYKNYKKRQAYTAVSSK